MSKDPTQKLFEYIALLETPTRNWSTPLTIDRIEKGERCRMETKRKIIVALGYDLSDKDKVFSEDN